MDTQSLHTFLSFSSLCIMCVSPNHTIPCANACRLEGKLWAEGRVYLPNCRISIGRHTLYDTFRSSQSAYRLLSSPPRPRPGKRCATALFPQKNSQKDSQIIRSQYLLTSLLLHRLSQLSPALSQDTALVTSLLNAKRRQLLDPSREGDSEFPNVAH